MKLMNRSPQTHYIIMKLFLGVAGASLLAFLMLPSPSLAQSVTTLQMQAEIQSLLATVHSLQQELTGLDGGSKATAISVPWCHIFTTNLEVGNNGLDVQALQQALSNDGENVTVSGTFDEQTASAVTGFQEKYRSNVLTPNGLTNGTGYVGKATRTELNDLFGCPGSRSPMTPVYGSPTSSSASTTTLTSIGPTNGPDGTQIALTGTGFTSSNEVLFGPQVFGGFTQSGIPSSNGTTLIFTVLGPTGNSPLCTSTGHCGGTGSGSPGTPPGVYPVSVENADGTTNTLPFTVTSTSTPIGSGSTSTPTVTKVEPSGGGIGMQVTLTGTNFTPTDNKVVFVIAGANWVAAKVPSQNGTSLTFTVPPFVIADDTCTPGGGCGGGGEVMGVQIGVYQVGVENGVDNSNGTSNTLPFSICLSIHETC